jgi:hypothetical protein
MRADLRRHLEKGAIITYRRPVVTAANKRPSRTRKPETEVTGHVDWWADLTWICDVCKAERPDRLIGVHAHDISQAMGLPAGCASYNVKFCKDNLACVDGAKDGRWLKLFERKTALNGHRVAAGNRKVGL